MIRRTAKWLLSIILGVMMYAYAMFQGGFVSWFLFYSVMPLLIYGWIIAIVPLRKIEIERTFPVGQLQAGQPFEVKLHVRKSYFPLFYVMIEDDMSMRLKKQIMSKTGSKALFFPLFKRNMSYTYEIPSLPRGEHLFTDVSIKTGDLFGFVEKKITIDKEQTLFVYPRVEMLDWKPASQGFSGMAAFKQRSKNEASAVVGVRDYIAGDRLSWLDWKATAKRNKLLTKQFEQQATEQTAIFLDNSKISDKGDQPELFERAVSIAASLVAATTHRGGLVILPGIESDTHPLVNGYNREQHLYYLLGKVEADGDDTFVNQIRRTFIPYSKGFHFVFITSIMTDELLSQFKAFVYKQIQVDVFYVTLVTSEAERQRVRRVVKMVSAAGANIHVIPHRRH